MSHERVTIVLVHGMSQAWKIAPTMERDLADAVVWGLTRNRYELPPSVSVRLAFYGNLYRPANLGDYRAGGDHGTDGPGRIRHELDMEPLVFDLLEELDGTEDDEAFDDSAQERGVAADAVRRIARIAERAGVDDLIVRTFVEEVARYLSNTALYLDTTGCVSSLMDEDETSCYVVLGHSLGSVVALEALHLNGDDRCLGIITMGSPLGLGVVLRALRRRGHQSIPRSVPRWTNVYDMDDFVCIAPRLGDFYSGTGPARIVDIETHGKDPSFTPGRLWAAHDFGIYLSSDEVSRALIGFLRNT